MLFYPDKNDTIVAIATAPGKGGIAIVRVSGPQAISVATPLFKSSKDPEKLDRVMVYGHIVDNETIDEVLMCIMKSPNSYTGEDVVEVHCHGGYAAAGAILGKLIERGARLAEPGEFTKRAFLSGKIDLIQAESVLEIVSAEGREHLRHAERLMEGEFSKRIEKVLDDIHHCLSLLEMNIDFHQENDETVTSEDLKNSINSTIKTLDTMITSYTTAKRIKEGLRVVLAGKVNAGKSSLFNALLGRKRAIVNEIPGTTRDWLEEKIELDGTAINLIDTAGLRETKDHVELEGVIETERFLNEADIIIYLEEVFTHITPTITHDDLDERYIHVLSKSDLLESKTFPNDFIPVSSKTGEGLHRLTAAIVQKAHELLKHAHSDTLVMIERHKIELQKVRFALYRALKSISTWSEEITAMELREAEKHIEALLGRNVEFDVLDTIFKNFCIGK